MAFIRAILDPAASAAKRAVSYIGLFMIERRTTQAQAHLERLLRSADDCMPADIGRSRDRVKDQRKLFWRTYSRRHLK